VDGDRHRPRQARAEVQRLPTEQSALCDGGELVLKRRSPDMDELDRRGRRRLLCFSTLMAVAVGPLLIA